MEEKKMSRPLSREEVFGIISDYLRSGMSCVDYYKSHDISEWQFYKWKRLYLLEHPEKKSPDKKTIINEESGFVPLEIGKNLSVISLPAIEVQYPGGVFVRISEGLTDLSVLKNLLNC